jgi:hypothetical protein
MKSGLLYAFFVMLTLILVSSDQKERGQIEVEVVSSQLFSLNCIIPEVNSSQKKDNSTLDFVQATIEIYFEDTYYQIFKLSETSNKFYLAKTVDLLPVTQTSFRHIIHYTSEIEDSSGLS